MSRESGEMSRTASLMLTTEAIISEISEEKKGAQMPGGHGGDMEGCTRTRPFRQIKSLAQGTCANRASLDLDGIPMLDELITKPPRSAELR